MTTLVILVVLLSLVGAVVFRPLFPAGQSSAGESGESGAGAEGRRNESQEDPAGDDASARAGAVERRTAEEEGAEARTPPGEPETATAGSRDGGSRGRRGRLSPLGGAVGFAGVAVLTFLTAFLVERQDIRRPGPILPETASAGSALPQAADGSLPDVDAMVSGLEERILSGDASADDIEMLFRSYAVLGREGEAEGLLRRAVESNPDRPVLQVGLALLLFDRPDPSSARESEALLDRVIEREESHALAQVYKSLLLARRGEVDAAIARLRRVEEMVDGDPAASELVSQIVERLTGSLDANPAPAGTE